MLVYTQNLTQKCSNSQWQREQIVGDIERMKNAIDNDKALTSRDKGDNW